MRLSVWFGKHLERCFRLLLHAADVEFEEDAVTFEEWPDKKPGEQIKLTLINCLFLTNT